MRQLAAAFLTASWLAACTRAVAKRARHEQARSVKAAASRRTPKRLRGHQAHQRSCHTNSIRPAPGSRVALLPEARQDIPQQRKPSRQRQQKDLPDKRGVVPSAPPLLLRSLPCLKNQHCRVFREVDSALVAFAAMILSVSASRADKAERSVAANAEFCPFGILTTALRALHKRTWWTRRDSNPRPQRCERRALPSELRAHESYYSPNIACECRPVDSSARRAGPGRSQVRATI